MQGAAAKPIESAVELTISPSWLRRDVLRERLDGFGGLPVLRVCWAGAKHNVMYAQSAGNLAQPCRRVSLMKARFRVRIAEDPRQTGGPIYGRQWFGPDAPSGVYSE
jgi:hypothetical protein